MNTYLAAYLTERRTRAAWLAEPARHVRMVRASDHTRAVARLQRATRELETDR